MSNIWIKVTSALPVPVNIFFSKCSQKMWATLPLHTVCLDFGLSGWGERFLKNIWWNPCWKKPTLTLLASSELRQQGSLKHKKFNSVVWPGQTHLSCTRLDPFLIHYAQKKKKANYVDKLSKCIPPLAMRTQCWFYRHHTEHGSRGYDGVALQRQDRGRTHHPATRSEAEAVFWASGTWFMTFHGVLTWASIILTATVLLWSVIFLFINRQDL